MGVLDRLLLQSEQHTVHSDQMDEKTFSDLKSQSASLQKAESAGTEVLKTFPPLTQDIWSSLFKFNPEFRKPEEMAQSHRFNATLRACLNIHSGQDNRMNRINFHRLFNTI